MIACSKHINTGCQQPVTNWRGYPITACSIFTISDDKIALQFCQLGALSITAWRATPTISLKQNPYHHKKPYVKFTIRTGYFSWPIFILPALTRKGSKPHPASDQMAPEVDFPFPAYRTRPQWPPPYRCPGKVGKSAVIKTAPIAQPVEILIKGQ